MPRGGLAKTCSASSSAPAGLTLLSSEFPEPRQLLFAWVDPLIKVLVKQ